jgi:hypothetical protein
VKSEAHEQTGEFRLDRKQASARGDVRSGVEIPDSSVPGEDLGYVTHHRIFACLPGGAIYPNSRWRKPARRSR